MTVRQRLAFGLSRELWLVEAGIFLNYLGWGGVMPFEIIYLHQERGFSLDVAGLVVGTVTGLAVASAPESATARWRRASRPSSPPWRRRSCATAQRPSRA